MNKQTDKQINKQTGKQHVLVFGTLGKNSSVWSISDIEDGSELIRRLDPHDHEAVELVPGNVRCFE